MQQQQNLLIGLDGNVQEPAAPNIVPADQRDPNDLDTAGQGRAAPGAGGNGPELGGEARRPGERPRIFARHRVRGRRPQPPPDPPGVGPVDGATAPIDSSQAALSANIPTRSSEIPDALTSQTRMREAQTNEPGPDLITTLTQFHKFCNKYPEVRRVWHQSRCNIDDTIQFFEAKNHDGNLSDVLDRLKWFARSPCIQSRDESTTERMCFSTANTKTTQFMISKSSYESQLYKEQLEMSARISQELHDHFKNHELMATKQNSSTGQTGDSTQGQSLSLEGDQAEPSRPKFSQPRGFNFHLDSDTEPEQDLVISFITNDKRKVVPVTDEEQIRPSSDKAPDHATEPLPHSYESANTDTASEYEVSEGTISPLPLGSPNDQHETDDAIPTSIIGTTPEDAATDDLPTSNGGSQNSDIETSEENAESNHNDHAYLDRIQNWLWGGVNVPVALVEQQGADDEHVVDDVADEAPFVPVAGGQHLLQGANNNDNPPQDPEVVAAAAQAGVDPNGGDAADEMEDLEGIMELIGMEGPIVGLVQNGMFFAVLVSLTILFGLWIPYAIGKLFLILTANPFTVFIECLRFVSTCADMVTDISIFLAGCAFYWLDTLVNFSCMPLGWIFPSLKHYTDNKAVAEAAEVYAEHALDRLAKASVLTSNSLANGLDIPTISAFAHESLLNLKSHLASSLRLGLQYYLALWNALSQRSNIAKSVAQLAIGGALESQRFVSNIIKGTLSLLSSGTILQRLNPLRINIATAPRSTPLNYELAAWNGTDRAIAIISGYIFLALLGMLYLRVAASIQGANKKGMVEGNLASVLYQAGGVGKVILIISIEMLLFPLYCGLLMDLALLPLFDGATFLSRVDFTVNSPWTSSFMHWFIGTCYMFHFALFISMCRKILRPGVLFFIRDPDDPTVHPVRDVLERHVSTQLWKICISAMVCGGLVMACLGVVWGIAAASSGIFPINWSSNEPVLEFPVDLLFYNFLMPTTIKLFRPSKALKQIYGWWFDKCARALRLSHFLLKHENKDEEGRHIQQTWAAWFRREKGNLENPVTGKDREDETQEPNGDTLFLRNGTYVRAPASDSVRLPAGVSAFLEVDADNNRLDGQEDKDDGLHGRGPSQFEKVYLPPHFRLRIGAFIFLVWLLTTVIGISVTTVPLIFGRFVFSLIAPKQLRMNDVYAFSIGIYILGGILYGLLSFHRFYNYLRETIIPHTTTIACFLRKTWSVLLRASRLLYTYGAFGILLPFVFSLLLEFYIIVPIQTYLSLQQSQASTNSTVSNLNMDSPTFNSSNDPHSFASASHSTTPIIHLVQDWTLGVLYVKLLVRLILWTSPSRPAHALRAVVRNGWLDPDVALATRGFIMPAIVAMAVVLTAPLALGWTATHTVIRVSDDNESDGVNGGLSGLTRTHVYRYSYPAMLGLVCLAVLLWGLGRALKGWRRKVRDEVYLIGERLHNFGEGRRKRGIGRVSAGKQKVT